MAQHFLFPAAKTLSLAAVFTMSAAEAEDFPPCALAGDRR